METINFETLKSATYSSTHSRATIVLTFSDDTTKTYSKPYVRSSNVESIAPEAAAKLAQYDNIRDQLLNEVNERGLIAIHHSSGYSSSWKDEIFFIGEEKKKVSESQSNALYWLLNREINDEISNTDSTKQFIKNDIIHAQTRYSLIRMGYVVDPNRKKEAIFSHTVDRMTLTETGRAKARELHPELTVAKRLEEMAVRANKVDREREIKRAISRHFIAILNPSNYYHSMVLHVKRLSGKIEDVEFNFHTSAAIGNIEPPTIKLIHRSEGYQNSAGWQMQIKAGHGERFGVSHGQSSIGIDPLYMAEFVEMVQAATEIIQKLTAERPNDYEGDLK